MLNKTHTVRLAGIAALSLAVLCPCYAQTPSALPENAKITFAPLVPGGDISFSCIGPAPETSKKAAAPTVSVPALKYQTRTLPNGLVVYSAENHATPRVAVQVWYKVGSKNDPPGRSGFAHLFEHMMFKATKNMKAEMFDRLTEDVGGENNAFTQDDVTVYHETVPSNYLETILWAEADRMANLKVDEANFKSERAVVQEEFRQSYLAPPYGLLQLAIQPHSYTTHPYKRPTIGSIENLDAASLADVQAFHKTFYRPDNAVLVVTGDFDPAQMNGWVDKYFGRVAKPSSTVPRVTVQEPPRTGEKQFKENGPNVPLPATVLTYLTPGVADNDAQALRIASTILSGGESSRLYRSLVYEQQIAAQADAGADLRTDNGLFTFTVIAAGGKTLEAAEKALLEQIEKFKTTPPTEAELEKARNQAVTGALSTRETNDGIASALGESAVLLGDPERINTDIARLQAVTAADVQRVMQKYLTPENRVVIRYTAAPKKAAK